jgi:hypothetical protein
MGLIATFGSALAYLSLCCSPAYGTTFFVANLGNDSNPGTSSALPWRTLARVNGHSFNGDDEILLKRGDIFREELIPPSSGSSGHKILISAYGLGANPIVSGADLVTAWQEISGNIWSATLATQPRVVFASGNMAILKPSLSLLSAPGQWTWNNGVLSIYSNGAPERVEAAQRDYALLIGQYGSGSYISIVGIDFRICNVDAAHLVNTSNDSLERCLFTGAYQFGIFAIGVNGTAVSHLGVMNNTISWNGSSGVEISSGHDHVTIAWNLAEFNAYNIENFEFTAGIYLYNENAGAPTYDVIEHNTSRKNGAPGGTESQGGGIWADTLGEARVISNFANGNFAHGIYLEKNTHSEMTDNLSVDNASAPNSANISVYASFGVSSIANMVARNVSVDSKGIGFKLGAYEGGGQTMFSYNTFEENMAANSTIADLYIDEGANNNGTDGIGNQYIGNVYKTQAGYPLTTTKSH